MPEESLRLLAQSAAETNAVLVLRGLHDHALKATLVRLRELLGDSARAAEPALVLDPTLFRRFDVDKVPTFVAALGRVERCTDSDCPVPEHLKVAGDVSLGYALQVMARRAKAPAMRDHIQRTRDRLQRKNRS
jgi:conjugal transfer pilus assembly protein TrbC